MNQEALNSEVTFYLCHTPEELFQKAAGVDVIIPRSLSPEGVSIQEEKYYTCPSCDRNFLTKENWLNHMQDCYMSGDHGEEDDDSASQASSGMYDHSRPMFEDKEDSNEVSVLLNVCGKVRGIDGKIRYSCFDPSCKKEFGSLCDIEQHLRGHVKEEIRFVCSLCTLEFETEKELNIHEDSHEIIDPAKPYVCPVCKKQFRFKVSLTRHVKSVHRNEKRFACTWCDKPFFEKSNLVKHMRVHTDDRPYGCEVCQKRFRQANSLRVHMKIHTNEDRFQCQICSRSFPTETGLEKHLQRHEVQEGMKCDVCQLSFPTRSTLSKHMLTHTGERAFACSVCEKRFYHKGHLTEHFRTHTGEKPFECKMCDRRFTQRTALTQHNARFHMDGKPFVCVCGEGFPRKCDLKVHKAECSFCV